MTPLDKWQRAHRRLRAAYDELSVADMALEAAEERMWIWTRTGGAGNFDYADIRAAVESARVRRFDAEEEELAAHADVRTSLRLIRDFAIDQELP